MKITINTTKFQEMLSKVIKGASNNRLLPITSLLSIKLENNVLYLTTTDATNYLTIKEPNVEGDDSQIVVQADNFVKLISRMTCDVISLDITNNYLHIVGNGSYKVEIVLDDSGVPIIYPNPVATFSKTNQIGTIELATIKTVLSSVKPALSTNLEMPCYTNYYIHDCVIATDTQKVSHLAQSLFSVPKLVSGDLVNLLDVVSDNTITVYSDGNKLLFESEHCIVYGFESVGIDNFSVDAIKNLVNQHYENTCKVSKNALLQLLDRISLFVNSDYDDGEIYLNFDTTSISVSSKQSTGVEKINYIDATAPTPFECSIDIRLLMPQVKAQPNDVITLEYGMDKAALDSQPHAIKLVGDQIISIVALYE